MARRSTSPRICEDCATEVTGKYRRRRCENCYRAMLRRESGVAERSVVQGNPAAYALANSTPGHGGCVLFTGWTTKGYGRISTGKGQPAVSAHRLVYEHLVGPVPDGLELDHVCHTRSTACPGGVTCLHRRCINPHHLEPVTTQENTRRAVERPNSRVGRRAWGDSNPAGLCGRGHEMTPENTTWEKYSATSDKRRPRCKTCIRSYQTALRERRRQSA